ncbi:succinate dehydrogenase, cytochrome b556 subunit [Sphingomonas sp.]|uniref:succinate dehydrogenase, cytochrome b556 subunit n=1 Tax=Sphingomonas sp. TaxID=28214 RepID=UPI0025E83812|nr:succinate dehydrogenase, cytochrome b556 subunit [Sphingomonas sp.]
MSRNTARPLSPHLSIWKWGPHMLVSILHRVMGVGLATVGVVGFVWWLTALAMGAESYAAFMTWAKWPPMMIFPIGLSAALFLHMCNGVRHFVLDTGAGYELKTNRTGARVVIAAAVLLTVVMWAYILLGKN